MKNLIFIICALISISSFSQQGESILHIARGDTAGVILKNAIDSTASISIDAAGYLQIKQELVQAIGYALGDSTTTISATGTYYTITDWLWRDTYGFTTTDSTATCLISGWYDINNYESFTHSAVNVITHLSLFIDDVELTEGGEYQRTITTGGNTGTGGISTRVYLEFGSVLKKKVKSNKIGTFTLNHGGFTITRVNQ